MSPARESDLARQSPRPNGPICEVKLKTPAALAAATTAVVAAVVVLLL